MPNFLGILTLVKISRPNVPPEYRHETSEVIHQRKKGMFNKTTFFNHLNRPHKDDLASAAGPVMPNFLGNLTLVKISRPNVPPEYRQETSEVVQKR